MNPAAPFVDAAPTGDGLLHLQLQIARRADELARESGGFSGQWSDWELWREAEAEILGCACNGQNARSVA